MKSNVTSLLEAWTTKDSMTLGGRLDAACLNVNIGGSRSVLVSINTNPFYCLKSHRAFRKFRQAKFAFGGSVLGSTQFSLLSQLYQK